MDQRQQQSQINDVRQHEGDKHDEHLDDSAEQRYLHADQRLNLHRMKRHPELQPYVPSDRYTTLSTGQSSINSINKITQHAGNSSGSRYLINNKPRTTSPMTTTSAGGNDSGQPKKYCSMTRLNQLAKPKMRPTTATQNIASTATLSSSSSSRSANSISRTLERQKESKAKPKEQQQRPKPVQRDEKQPDASHRPTQKQQPWKLAESNSLKVDNQPPKETQQKQTPKQREQQPKQQQRRLSDQPQPITPITSVKPTTMITPLSPTSVMPTQTPQSSTPVVRDHKTTPGNKPSPSTPAVQLPTPASSLEEELESATKTSKNDITRDIVIEPDDSIVEQVSEMSVNDRFYQSATSELVPDSENSTNGINYDRNAESLCREFEQDLIAKGIVTEDHDQDEFKSPMSNGKDESVRRSSAATIVTSPDNLLQSEQSPQTYDEEDRRLKIEKELRNQAKKEEDDRKEREQLVESILSKFSHGSVS